MNLTPQWIWTGNDNRTDVYVRFKTEFELENVSDVKITLSCDTFYNVYVNGKIAKAGWFFDYEFYKMKDVLDITDYCNAGNNVLEIVVWYHGETCINYRSAKAGLYFCVTAQGKTVAVSSEAVLCREESGYVQNNRRLINGCVGLSFKFDANDETVKPYLNSVVTDKTAVFAETDSDVKNLVVGDKTSGKIIKKSDGSYLVDFGKECVGFIGFKLKSSELDNEIKIYYGEHAEKNSVIGYFNGDDTFRAEYVAKRGENEFENRFRVFGLRYLEFVSTCDIELERVWVLPVYYPFIEKPFIAKTELDQKIYDTCLYTLKCCTSKHYYDCPKREQGMYIQDSRNQMLCGYEAFDNEELIRFNLLFLSKGANSEGLLYPAPPCNTSRIIPFFNLVYVMQVCEYLERFKDDELLKEVEPVLDAIMQNFIARINKKNGLIYRFEAPSWNFYEWTQGNDNWLCDLEENDDKREKVYDVNLNSAFIIAIEKYAKIKAIAGKCFEFGLNAIRKSVKRELFCPSVGLFKNSSNDASFSRLGNSLAVLAGILDKKDNRAIAEKMLNGNNITDISLASVSFYYDALLSVDESYKDVILNDIRVKYKSMLDKGATTVWETIGGSDDFGGSGSLCHGWAALPIYYYRKFY